MMTFRVEYKNNASEPIAISKWVNNAHSFVAADGQPAFWSYQGASYEDRRDWVLPLAVGFSQQNYFGMNASDYGSGTPVSDVWRRDIGVPGYARHRPETTLLYQLVEQHYPAFRELRAMAGRPLPDNVEEEFDAYLKCGRMEEGFLRLRCEQCHAEKLVAFSCKKRGFCPSCGARRMAETAALLADEVMPERPLRQ
jgi:ribosomal protein S27E